jgi:hypothetical protein
MYENEKQIQENQYFGRHSCNFWASCFFCFVHMIVLSLQL